MDFDESVLFLIFSFLSRVEERARIGVLGKRYRAVLWARYVPFGGVQLSRSGVQHVISTLRRASRLADHETEYRALMILGAGWRGGDGESLRQLLLAGTLVLFAQVIDGGGEGHRWAAAWALRPSSACMAT